MPEAERVVGLVGLFDDPDSLIRAAETVRDAGYTKWDCHTPYPVHGLDGAMGLRPSPIPFLALCAGFAGVGVAMAMQGWMNAIDYPINIGGKPLFSWPAFVPITFELFVMFAAVTAFGAMLALCRLLRWHSPLGDSGILPEVTGSRFAIVLETADERFSEEGARSLLEGAGAAEIRPLIENAEEASVL